VKVPARTFWYSGGGKPGTERKTTAADFYVGVYEVTQKQWETVMGSESNRSSHKGPYFPVENVSYDEINNEFMRVLNEKEGVKGWTYRLPTEVEWEYCCRGGATSSEDCSFDFYFDRPTNALSPQLANYGHNVDKTTRVGSYKPNRLGIYDLHGNVWEWTLDSSDGGSFRVIRGGGWISNAVSCRAAYRGWNTPVSRSSDLGFRAARVPSGQ
jgi:formylglycine-generating enzyme required for sulfatase activity